MTEPRTAEPIMPTDTSFQQRLRDAMARTAASVAVVTVEHEGLVHGATISSFVSVSMEPPIALLSLHRSSSMVHRIESSRRFGLTVLAQGQEAIARALSRPDRSPLAASALVEGCDVPLVRDGCARFALGLRRRLCVGDHHLMLVDVIWTQASDLKPLVYQMRRYATVSSDVDASR